jgi:hypothetical protein
MSAPILRDGMLADLLLRCLTPKSVGELTKEMGLSAKRVQEVAARGRQRGLLQTTANKMFVTEEGRAAVSARVSRAILEIPVPASQLRDVVALSAACERGDAAALRRGIGMLVAALELKVAA